MDGGSQQITLSLPPIPLTDLLLALVCYLTWRLLRQLEEFRDAGYPRECCSNRDERHDADPVLRSRPRVGSGAKRITSGRSSPEATTASGAPAWLTAKASPPLMPVPAPPANITERLANAAPVLAAALPSTMAFAPAVTLVERFLRDSAQLFAECLLDENDVDTAKFLHACRHFATVLEKAGPFTMLSIRGTLPRATRTRAACSSKRVIRILLPDSSKFLSVP
jgi:hypothetical protein